MRIFFERAFEILQTFPQIFLSRFVGIEETVQINVVSSGATDEPRRNRCGDIELQFQCIDNRPRNFILERKDSLHLAFECLRPKREAIATIRQLGADADAIPVATHTAFKHVLHVELVRDFLQVRFLVLKPKRGAARGHPQSLNLCQRCLDFLRDAFAEIITPFARAQIGKREDCNGPFGRTDSR